MLKHILFFLLLPLLAQAQLKEFAVNEMPRPDVAVVQANKDFPEDALILVYSSIRELNFRSSLGGIDKVSFNPAANRYEILARPLKQMVFVYCKDFMEMKISTINPNPKDVLYYKVEEKVISTADAEPGVLKIVSAPPEAAIKVNGMQIVDKTPSLVELPPGKFKLTLENNGYLPYDTIIEVISDEVSTLNAILIEDSDFTLLGEWEYSATEDDWLPSFLMKIEENGKAILTVYEAEVERSPSFRTYEYKYEGHTRGSLVLTFQKAYQLGSGISIPNSSLDSLREADIVLTFRSSSTADLSCGKRAGSYIRPIFKGTTWMFELQMHRVDGDSDLPFLGRWFEKDLGLNYDYNLGYMGLLSNGTGGYNDHHGPYTEKFTWVRSGTSLLLSYKDMEASWGNSKTFPTGTYIGQLSLGPKYELIWKVPEELPDYWKDHKVKVYSRFDRSSAICIDPAGREYETVQIGDQLWMAENLAYKPPKGNYWAYDNEPKNVATYGYLYDWETAKEVCPAGWHLPTDAEWTVLTDYLGGQTVASGKMKNKTGWNPPNTNATNESGFSGAPGGYRKVDGNFGNIGNNGNWWSSSASSGSTAWGRPLYTYDNDASRGSGSWSFGFSVRCVKD